MAKKAPGGGMGKMGGMMGGPGMDMFMKSKQTVEKKVNQYDILGGKAELDESEQLETELIKAEEMAQSDLA